MNWTAILPFKGGTERKSRLSGRLSLEARVALSETMARSVVEALRGDSRIGRILILSPERPECPAVEWEPDQGKGLNAELQRMRDSIPAGLLVIFADLPLLAAADVRNLLDAAEADGVALAPDRHHSGTNAVALADDRTFDFAFGPGSLAAHAAQGRAALVIRDGLSLDIDEPADFDHLQSLR